MNSEQRIVGRVLNSRSAGIVVCVIAGVLLPAVYGGIKGIPVPTVHDEFAYLLQASTFAQGRLTNSSPAQPEFFEAEHILVVPSYNSKYPPGQSMVLAAGQLALGHPIWGVWLSCGMFSGSLCWMLQAWTSKRWAFVVTVFAIVTLGVSSYWAQSYWGGMLPGAGGALTFGGLRRLVRFPRPSAAFLMSVGAMILAVTRPYEGAIACLPVALAIGVWAIREKNALTFSRMTHVFVPAAIVIGCAGTFLAIHNRAVTGKWWLLPYVVHHRQYFHQGGFVFSELRESQRRPVAHVARFYEADVRTPVRGAALVTRVGETFFIRLPAMIHASLGEVWLLDPLRIRYGSVLCLLALSYATLGKAWTRFAIFTLLLLCLGSSFILWWSPHYAAPVLPLVLAMFSDVLRRIGLSSVAGNSGRLATPFAVLCVILGLGLFVNGVPALANIAKGFRPSTAGERNRGDAESRESVRRRLMSITGLHLVFVRYSDDVNEEWVYNEPLIESARVVFAHDLGPEKNKELIATLQGRGLWVAAVSLGSSELLPYSDESVVPAGASRE